MAGLIAAALTLAGVRLGWEIGARRTRRDDNRLLKHHFQDDWKTTLERDKQLLERI